MTRTLLISAAILLPCILGVVVQMLYNPHALVYVRNETAQSIAVQWIREEKAGKIEWSEDIEEVPPGEERCVSLFYRAFIRRPAVYRVIILTGDLKRRLCMMERSEDGWRELANRRTQLVVLEDRDAKRTSVEVRPRSESVRRF